MARPLVPNDLLRLRIAQSPVLSVDGRVAFAVQENDAQRDERRTCIWLADARGTRRFTSGTKDSGPRFSPDGRTLAFVRGDGERGRMHLIPADGGEAREVGEAYHGLRALRWSPDGRRIAFVARSGRAPEAGVYRDERSGARHIRTLLYKSDEEGLSDGRRLHLFVLDLEGERVEQITRGEFDVAAPCWSPDGSEIAFAAQRDLPETSFRSDIWVVDVASGTLRKLTRSLGWAASPAYAHDGHAVAFIGHEGGEDGPSGARNMQLFTVSRAGDAVRCISEGYAYGIGDHVITDTRGHGTDLLAWSEDDGALFTLATVEGSAQVVRFELSNGRAISVAGGAERTLLAADVGPAGIAFVASDPLAPAVVGMCALDGGGQRGLADLNPWLAEIELVAPERLRPTHADGTRLDLWVLRPPHSTSAPPLVFEIHGGPHGCYGTAFFFEFQMLAARGFAVAYGNIRGSQSYGEPFARAVIGDWGGIDVEDALVLLDTACAHAAADRTRVAVAGGSYGGYMSSLLMGRAPDRFACGVSMRAVNEVVSMIGTSDFGWFLEMELGASLTHNHVERLSTFSPLTVAEAYRAPLLILHSERDYRCPFSQAEQLFHLLRRLGKRVEMVRFEKDPHGLSREGHPRNRILRLRAIVHWLERWLVEGVEQGADAGWLFAPLGSDDNENTGE